MKITRSSIINILLAALLLVIVLVPDARATVMSGLMKIGLFKPDISRNTDNFIPESKEIMFRDGNGKIVSLEDLKGKVVLINFWATWCPPCRAEMPSLNNLYKEFSNNKAIIFITVDADANYTKAKKFLDKKNYELPLYVVASDIPQQLFSGSLPTTIILDKQGKLVFRHEGAANYADAGFNDFLKGLTEK